MALAFRLKTQPEILLSMLAQARAESDINGNGDIDLNVGSVGRIFLETAAESDADQYIQISKLLKLFSIFTAKGVDLDERMRDLGSDIFPEMRRLAANTSIGTITVGDGALLVSSALAADTTQNALTFSSLIGDGSKFPISGGIVLEQGTTRQETIVYKRSGDVFTVLYPTTGCVNSHPVGGTILSIATRSFLQAPVSIGATIITLPTGTGAAWASSGSVILDQGTVSEEKKTFTRSVDTLTVAALTFGHNAGTSLIQSTFGSDRNIPFSQVCYVPATDTSKEIDFRVSQSNAKLLDGAFVSDPITIESILPGSATKVGSNIITKWQSPPFTGATVTNPTAVTRGREREDDSSYVQRVVNFIQSLSRGTPLATTTLTNGVTDPVTGAQVAFAQIVEPVAPGMSVLYISDGTATFALTQIQFQGRDVLISDAESGDRRGKLSQYGPFVVSATTPTSPRIFTSFQRGTATAVAAGSLTDTTKSLSINFYNGAYLKADDNTFYKINSNTANTFTLATTSTPSLGVYAIVDFGTFPQISSTSTSVSANTLTDTTQTMTINAHVGKWVVDSAGKAWQVTANTATAFTLAASGATPASGAYTLTAGNPIPLIPGTDYLFNQTNGDIELVLSKALQLNDCMLAASDGANPSVGAYTYTTGLGAYVQRLVNGDPSDFTNFPGIRADGTQVLVTAPITVSTTFTLQVIAARGFSDQDITADVQSAVETYVNSLGIGEDVIISEIIRVVKSLVGVADVKMIDPTSNVTVPAGSIMRITASSVVPV